MEVQSGFTVRARYQKWPSGMYTLYLLVITDKLSTGKKAGMTQLQLGFEGAENGSSLSLARKVYHHLYSS